ncbi:N-acyl homoserine lactonase family protein [Gilvimarinus sp. SDUM040013]|uniref:N-acyl homoserine lactonase family protein n=1 Tax=Gilvimarinus gilvus TaxID=3058038 RepID=A0ABU4RZU5_9GAMM|nr:N-acyl homoserine lactonase family protein [Gilvimarinus sp. SDUM040013]MDO3384760.1 N-acyl homoserine lactonase family protein [Gilvimarinus sp. SDUM040013]MDX6850422.1 N-acyl homoserine lactonase family protein [Gilvimarinus sp. SDUM040013]
MRLLSSFFILLMVKVSVAAELPRLSTSGEVPITLYVLDCGHLEARKPSLFNPLLQDDEPLQMVSPCFLVRHPEATLLWDTGLDDALAELPEGIEVMDGAFRFWVEKPLAAQLQELNIPPESVDYLVFSHLHRDHTGNSSMFSQAQWLMQGREKAMAYSDQASAYGYHPDHYHQRPADKVTPVEGHVDVFGDGSVVILSTPGHTQGHQSLYIDLAETGPVVLSGDLYHFALNREHYGIPVWNDKATTIQSFAFIDEVLAQTNAQLWIQHDSEEFAQHIKAPESYR